MKKCRFCNKEFKSDSTFEKHNCIKKQRYDTITDDILDWWIKLCSIYKIKIPTTVDGRKLSLINSSMYKPFISFSIWAIEMDAFNIPLYLEYLYQKQYKIKNWADIKIYDMFLKDYLNKETLEASKYRGEKYCEKNNIILSECSPNKLFLLLRYGLVNIKYVKWLNIPYQDILSQYELQELAKLMTV